ncbi:MAG: helix-turn-helix transcriptional regulator [Clostridia bacterium]|nr:helix-turn-helix transcriptional regulator [Clostridia bacterium]
MKFNCLLKEIRKSRGYTQKDIYTLLNVSPNCYASWEQGRTEPDVESIKKLCIIFEVSADELLGLEYPDGTKVYAKNYIHNVNNHGNMTIK